MNKETCSRWRSFPLLAIPRTEKGNKNPGGDLLSRKL